MVEVRLVLDGGVDVAVAILYTLVGRAIGRRGLPEPEAAAWRRFRLFFSGLALTGLVAALMSLTVAFDVGSDALHGALNAGSGVAFTIAMWGLMGYLLFLVTGRHWTGTVTVLYAAYALLLVAQPIWAGYQGMDVEGWRPVARYAEMPGAAWTAVSLALLLVPQTVTAGAYLVLLPRVEVPAARYRMTLLAATLLLWTFGVVLIAQPAAAPSDALQALGRLLVLLSAFLVLAAYRPPAWARRRFGAQASV